MDLNDNKISETIETYIKVNKDRIDSLYSLQELENKYNDEIKNITINKDIDEKLILSYLKEMREKHNKFNDYSNRVRNLEETISAHFGVDKKEVSAVVLVYKILKKFELIK